MAALDGLFEQLGATLAPLPCGNPSCQSHRRRWRALLGQVEEPIRLNGRLYCGPDCFEEAARTLLVRLLPGLGPRKLKPHRIPLGLLMLSKGLVDDERLRTALKAQQESGSGRLGEWLCRLGAADEARITAALGIQWSCPIFPLEKYPAFISCASLVPLPILESIRMLLVHYLPVARHLYVTFSDGIDYAALSALEQMFECRTEPSLASQSAFDRALDEIRRLPRPPEVHIQNPHDPAAMARILRRYVADGKTRSVRMTSCDEFLWARLETANRATNFLFEACRRRQDQRER